jgi:rod shape-determining protein MreD
MNRKTVLGFIVPGLVVLHFLLHVGIGLGRIAPDLITLALLLAARETGMGWGGAVGFLLGLFEDAFSVLAFGASTLAMTVVGILGSRTRDLFVGDSLFFLLVYLLLGKLLRDFIYWLAAGEIMRGPFVNTILIDGLFGAVYVAAVGFLLFLLFGESRALR